MHSPIRTASLPARRRIEARLQRQQRRRAQRRKNRWNMARRSWAAIERARVEVEQDGEACRPEPAEVA